jgi:hypothetical protein
VGTDIDTHHVGGAFIELVEASGPPNYWAVANMAGRLRNSQPALIHQSVRDGFYCGAREVSNLGDLGDAKRNLTASDDT